MKTILTLTILSILASGNARATDETAEKAAVGTSKTVGKPAAEMTATNSPVLLANGEPGLRLNFRGASLDLVLNYLSEAAGFIIVLDTKVTGKIDAWSNQPLSKDEAVELLNSVLNKNGYAAIRHGRTLNIVNKDDAKTKDIPVILESDPDKIPKTDEMVTQIMPVKSLEVTQLIKDLQPLVATTTTMTANEAGNSIIMTDTRANINRVAQIIRAIDQGAEEMTEVKVFRLEFADPTEMATLLNSLFSETGGSSSSSSSSGSSSPFRFDSGRSSFRDMFRGGGDRGGESSSGSSQNQRIKKRTKVTAVADARTASVVISTTSGLMSQIEEMVKQLDADPAKKQKVYVYQVNPGDVAQVQQVLQDMFESSTASRSSSRNSSQNNVLQNRANQSQTTSGNGSSTSGSGRSSTGSSGSSAPRGGGF
jgi:general secretion pathway protein D